MDFLEQLQFLTAIPGGIAIVVLLWQMISSKKDDIKTLREEKTTERKEKNELADKFDAYRDKSDNRLIDVNIKYADLSQKVISIIENKKLKDNSDTQQLMNILQEIKITMTNTKDSLLELRHQSNKDK